MAYTGSSIVDYLGSTGQASDYASRAKLAATKGISGYAGTAEQNTQLLNALRAGSNPSATTPQNVPTVTSIPNKATPTVQYATPAGPHLDPYTANPNMSTPYGPARGNQDGSITYNTPNGASTVPMRAPSPVAPYKQTTPKDTFVQNQVAPKATAPVPTPPQVNTPTETPQVASVPAGPSAADTAFAEYLKSLMPSSEETEAQRYLNTLNTDANLANERALNSGETMGFAGGEAQRVGRNNDIRIAGQSARLQQIQANRANMTEAQKARLDYEQNKEKITANANPAFELSPGQERWGYNAKTGKYEKTASVAKDPLDAKYKQAQIDNLYADNTRADTTKPKAESQADDVATAILDFQQQMKTKGWAGANPNAYQYYREQLKTLHGSAAVLALDKAMADAGISIDNRP